MVLAAIKQTEIDGRVPLDDAGVQDVLRKQVKLRQESIADFSRAGRGRHRPAHPGAAALATPVRLTG